MSNVIIDLKNIDITFTQKRRTIQAVKDVSIQIEKGDIYGIVGYSGAGKSTLVRAINLLQVPTAGKITIGKDVTFADGKVQLSTKELRQKRQTIGMIFQHFNLMAQKTAYENVAFALRHSKLSIEEKDKKIRGLLELVDLADRAENYPAQLSGGQKQRVAIARALANDPEILISDESTSALDPKTTNSILELIKNIQQKFGLTVVMITHQMEVIRDICNRVAVMSDGEIVETGGVHHIFSNPKAEITKELISYLPSTEERGVEIMKTKGKYIVKLKFLGTIAEEPIISQALRKFDIDFSIIGGSIDHLSTMKVGHLFIELSGEIKQQQEAIEWFNESGVMVEVIYNGI